MPVNFEKIRQLREAAGLTQGAAAARAQELGASGFRGPSAKVRWSDIETGKYPDPRISTLEAVAQVLGCAVQDLLAPATPASKPRVTRRA